MPFTKTATPEPYIPSPPAVLDGDIKVLLERELRQIQNTIQILTTAVVEIQDYLETL